MQGTEFGQGKAAQEMVSNHMLRGLRTSPKLIDGQLDRALSDAGVDASILTEPGALIPLRAEVRVLDALVRHNDDPLLAVRLGQTHESRTGSILAYIAYSSATVLQALENLSEFSSLTRPRSRVSLVETSEGVEFRMEHPDIYVQTAVAHKEYWVAAVMHTLSDATDRQIVPEQVYFSTPLGHRDVQIERLLGCAVTSGVGRTALVFNAATLDLQIKSCDVSLLAHLTDYGRLLLEQRRPQTMSLQEQVFRAIVCRLTGGVPRLSEVASELAMSERTLSRRLADDGTSYRALVDSTRVALATALLDDPGLSLTEISFLLGFTDQSTFSHAFRRWTGKSPVQARQARRSDVASFLHGGERQEIGT